MIDRKPSHFGSKLYGPSGIFGTGLASIGATGGLTGSCMPLSCPNALVDRPAGANPSRPAGANHRLFVR